MLKPEGIELYLLSRPWLVAVIWFVLYAGDYYLTLIGHRYYRAQNFVKYEGS